MPRCDSETPDPQTLPPVRGDGRRVAPLSRAREWSHSLADGSPPSVTSTSRPQRSRSGTTAVVASVSSWLRRRGTGSIRRWVGSGHTTCSVPEGVTPLPERPTCWTARRVSCCSPHVGSRTAPGSAWMIRWIVTGQDEPVRALCRSSPTAFRSPEDRHSPLGLASAWRARRRLGWCRDRGASGTWELVENARVTRTRAEPVGRSARPARR